MVKKLTASVLFAAIASACLATDKPATRDTGALRAKLQRQMVDGLRDPGSAQVRGAFLSAAETGGVVSLCGEVNAKNAYGGFVGFSGFISTSDGMVILQASEPEGSFGHVWPVWCGRPMGRR